MNTWYVGVVYSSIFLGAFIFIEYFVRKMNISKEITRRVAHVLSCLFGLVMGLELEATVFMILCIFFFVVISISLSVRFFTFIHNVRRKTYGELLLPIGILLPYLVGHDKEIVFSASVLILAIADPIAGIVGDIFIHKYSLRTITFFLLALFVLLVMLPPGKCIVAIMVASLITIVERISPYGTDNLTIPLICSVSLKLLLQS